MSEVTTRKPQGEKERSMSADAAEDDVFATTLNTNLFSGSICSASLKALNFWSSSSWPTRCVCHACIASKQLSPTPVLSWFINALPLSSDPGWPPEDSFLGGGGLLLMWSNSTWNPFPDRYHPSCTVPTVHTEGGCLQSGFRYFSTILHPAFFFPSCTSHMSTRVSISSLISLYTGSPAFIWQSWLIHSSVSHPFLLLTLQWA